MRGLSKKWVWLAGDNHTRPKKKNPLEQACRGARHEAARPFIRLHLVEHGRVNGSAGRVRRVRTVVKRPPRGRGAGGDVEQELPSGAAAGLFIPERLLAARAGEGEHGGEQPGVAHGVGARRVDQVERVERAAASRSSTPNGSNAGPPPPWSSPPPGRHGIVLSIGGETAPSQGGRGAWRWAR